MNTEPKISSNRQKKMAIVTDLTEKFGKANAIVFTNYQGLTHKQIEGLKKAIKPLKAEFVVAKNSLLTLALAENKYKLEKDQVLDGQTGTLFLYEDVISPLKALAKTIKELNLPSVKFGIMEKNFITGEQVLKLSTLPTREVLLAQLVGGLKSPIFGLHRALNWNLQKLVMTLNAVVGIKPAIATASATKAPLQPATTEIPNATPQTSETTVLAEEKEPETILAETVEEKIQELPDKPVKAQSPVEGTSPTPVVKSEETEEQPKEIIKSESSNEDNKKPLAQEATGTESSNEDNKGGEN